ncbi:hypothetical protein [Massilia sp. YIM B02443]|uniref:hypothetical protein n=1 Tax=Massilia sp. YIM B02443 TaxID=3050127 RepID=UPI0025B634CC|nr:hypothetical protein [Massilia sp. YIM B02443]MDN4037878.1 hypothetical protein [Massilia sp. YIM B02443]
MRWTVFKRLSLLAAAFAAALGTLPVQASDTALDDTALSAFGAPVAADTLDGARGGFEVAGGLNLALGIERVVSVNGEVLSRTNISIPDLAAMTSDQARLAQDALGSAKLIQLGGNNFVASDIALNNGATLLQNTLDGQDIRAATTISSTVNSMSLLKDMNFQSTIREGIVRSAGNL